MRSYSIGVYKDPLVPYNLVSNIQAEQRGETQMSYAHAVISGNNIVLASDSRSVEMRENGDPFFVTDTCPKITYLEDHGVGCVFVGNNMVRQESIIEYVRGIEISGQTVLEKLQCIAGAISYALPEGGYVGMACGGFDDAAPVLFGASIFSGEDPGIEKIKAIWHTDKRAAALFYDENLKLDARLQDAGALVEFSDFLVQTEIGIARFRNNIPVVGGPVQTLLLTAGDHFWIHRLGEWQK